MKVVIDTNVVLISIPSRSPYHEIVRAFNKRIYQLIITTPIFFEYEEILTEKANPFIANNVLEAFLEAPNVLSIRTHYRWNMIVAYPDDNKFTDAYINGNADYLITNDAHFNAVKNVEFPKINILSPDEFIKLL